MQKVNNNELKVPQLVGGGGVVGYEAIILAGGLGTRLRTVVSDLPKCMAPVAGKPFLHYVLQHLLHQGIDKFIFSLGYLSESIEAFLSENFQSVNYQLSIENEPLGTGGAIQLAAQKATEKNVIVLNGDTLFAVDVKQLYHAHINYHSACTLSLKPMENFERYGAVELNDDRSVASFREKQFYRKGYINGGVYALNTEAFLQEGLPEKFSFEKEYLEKKINQQKFYGFVQDKYFIDIGIPEDFERAQQEFATLQL
jgi:D-glycero-alpha-D-manno-heptose 1-phosphate guanylyltransferase